MTIAVDSSAAAEMASAAARGEGTTLDVVIEYDIGMHRSGVESIPEALALADRIDSLGGLEFRGVMAYEGHLVKTADRSARTAAVLEAFAPMPALLAELGDHGHEVSMFTGGASSTYDVSGNLPFMTDLEAGSYVLMEYAAYVRLVPEFEPALAVVATVARSRPGRPLVVDAGAERIGSDVGTPVLAGFPATHQSTSEEYNRSSLMPPACPASVITSPSSRGTPARPSPSTARSWGAAAGRSSGCSKSMAATRWPGSIGRPQ